MRKKNSKDCMDEKIYFTLIAFCNKNMKCTKGLAEVSLKIDGILEDWL